MLAVQFSVAECAGTPVPDRLIETGELDALLVTVTLPVTPPVAAGAKVTFTVTTCAEVMIWPLETPLAVKPAPEIVTLETVMLVLPELVKVMPRELLLPTVTLLKFKLVVLGVSAPGGGALTVSVAALLVALPAELLTVTVNCVPLAEVVSVGVV